MRWFAATVLLLPALALAATPTPTMLPNTVCCAHFHGGTTCHMGGFCNGGTPVPNGLCVAGGACITRTPTRSPTPSVTTTPADTATVTETPTVTATPTITPTRTVSATATNTFVPTATFVASPPATPTPTPTSPVIVSVDPATTTTASGSTFTVTIKITTDGRQTCGGGVFLQFDPALLVFAGGTNNSAFWGMTTNSEPAVQEPGIVSLEVGGNVKSGTGLLVSTLTFTAISAGTSALTLLQEGIHMHDTVFSDSTCMHLYDTRVVSGTVVASVAPTPTPVFACAPCTLTGQVFDLNTAPAAGRRLTIETVREQIIHGCLVHVSLNTVTLDDQGFLPPTATAESGATVRVSLESDVPLEIVLPTCTIQPLAPLIAAATSRPPPDTIPDIVVAPTGDFTLLDTHAGKTIALTTSTVNTFHLLMTSDAAGHRIHDVFRPPIDLPSILAPGDLLASGDFAGGDLAGTLPNPTLHVILPGQRSLANTSITAGTCTNQDTKAMGATVGDAVAVSPVIPSTRLAWSGWVPMQDTVRVQLCALADDAQPPSSYDVRVMP